MFEAKFGGNPLLFLIWDFDKVTHASMNIFLSLVFPSTLLEIGWKEKQNSNFLLALP